MWLRRWAAILVAAGLSAVPAYGGDELPEKFTLGRYVPDSCWFYIHAVDNPERQFIDDNWAKVFKAAEDVDLFGAVREFAFSAVPADRLPEFEKNWIKMEEMCGQIAWSELASEEFVWAMQMAPFPSHLLLFRGTEGSAERNHVALVKAVEQIAGMNEAFRVYNKEFEGVDCCRLIIADAPITLAVFRKGDVIGLCTCSVLTKRTTRLMSCEEPTQSIVRSEKFRAALADLPAPEDSVVYLDMQAACRGSLQFFDRMWEKMGRAEEQEQTVTKVLHKLGDRFDFLDYIVEVTHTDGYREVCDSVVRVQPQARDKLLAKALLDLEPIADPLQYIPAEATAFMATEGVDWATLYKLLQTIITEDIPNGAAGWAHWEKLLADTGLDMDRDVFSWLGRQVVSVSLTASAGTLFSTSDEVWMIRVTDTALARGKVDAMIDNGARLLDVRFGQPLIIQHVPEVRGEGFRSVTHPAIAAFFNPVIGVQDQWLIMGTSAQGINAVLDTVAGKRPDITSNERFKRDGLAVSGEISGTSFADLSNMNKEIGQVAMIMGMIGGFQGGALHDARQRAAHASGRAPNDGPSMQALFRIIEKVLQVASEIDFYSSMSTVTTRDENGWRGKTVTTYKTPAELERP